MGALRAWLDDRIRLRDTRPFRTENRPYLAPKKSLFSKIVGEPHAGGFELTFAGFLDGAPDVAAFAKNYLAVGFKIDYVKADGDLSTYTPDFIVKSTDGTVWIVETKGRAELDLPQKMARLRQWCADLTPASQAEGGPAAGQGEPETSVLRAAVSQRHYEINGLLILPGPPVLSDQVPARLGGLISDRGLARQHMEPKSQDRRSELSPDVVCRPISPRTRWPPSAGSCTMRDVTFFVRPVICPERAPRAVWQH